MPLVRSWWLGKKKGKEAWVRPIIVADPGTRAASGWSSRSGTGRRGRRARTRTGRSGATARRASRAGRRWRWSTCARKAATGGLGAQLMAVVAEGNRRRVYLPPNDEHRRGCRSVERPESAPEASLPARGASVPRPELWPDAVGGPLHEPPAPGPDDVQRPRHRGARARAPRRPRGRRAPGDRLESGGTDAEAYADAVATYLGLSSVALTDYRSTIVLVASIPRTRSSQHVFARQAIPMTWDFAEAQSVSLTARAADSDDVEVGREGARATRTGAPRPRSSQATRRESLSERA